MLWASFSATANRRRVSSASRLQMWLPRYHYYSTVIEVENNTRCCNNTRLRIHHDMLVIMLARCFCFVRLNNPNWTSDGKRLAQPLNDFHQVNNRMYGLKHWSKFVSKTRKVCFCSPSLAFFFAVKCSISITIVQEIRAAPLLRLCSHAVGVVFGTGSTALTLASSIASCLCSNDFLHFSVISQACEQPCQRRDTSWYISSGGARACLLQGQPKLRGNAAVHYLEVLNCNGALLTLEGD